MNEHMFDNEDIFDAGLLLDRLRCAAARPKNRAALSPHRQRTVEHRLLPSDSHAIIELIADKIEDLLPSLGRRPTAWIDDLGWEERHDGFTPYVDVAAIDTHAAAAVAKSLNGIAGLTYRDWLFRWRRSSEGHRLIRTYPSYEA